jgi:hypothetical protein
VEPLELHCKDHVRLGSAEVNRRSSSVHLGSPAGAEGLPGGPIWQRTPDQILGPYFPVQRTPHAGSDLTVVQATVILSQRDR